MAAMYIPPLLVGLARGLWFDLSGAKLSWAWWRGHWSRSWAQAANGWAELRDGWDAGSMRHGTIRTLLVAGRCPLTAGPLVSAMAGSIQYQGDAGGVMLVRRLSHSSFSWASLGCKEQRGLAGTRGPMVPCKATPFVGSLATIFSSGCRGMTGCFHRSSHLAVHGRWGEREGEARCRSWRD